MALAKPRVVVDEQSPAQKSPDSVKPMASFSEKDFREHITDLCDKNKHEAAAQYLLRNGERLLRSNLNGKEKFNHLLFLPRMIQSGSVTKHGYRKLLRKVAGVESFISAYQLPPGGSFIELGCGAHDPLAMATYFYLNGYGPSYGIDLLEPRNERYSALSMYDILANVRCFPKRYCREGVEPKQILDRASRFNLGSFEQGEWTKGFGKVANDVKFLIQDICEADLPEQSVSLLVSFAVFEHVSELDRVCETIHRLLKPGGLAFHFVDLADHRSYRGDGAFGPLSFLAEEEAPPNMNRLRAFEISKAHQKAGFEILKDNRTPVEMPDAIRDNLASRFRPMAVDDLRVIKQQLLVRRPA